MIKILCDICEKELKTEDPNGDWVIKFNNRHFVQLTYLLNRTYHAGQICQSCIKMILGKGEWENQSKYKKDE